MQSVQSRWIAQVEARVVLEGAALHRAASEPHVSVTCTRAGRTGLDRLRDLPQALGRAVAAIRSLPVDATVRIHPGSGQSGGQAARLSSAELDNDRILLAVLITDIVDSTKRVAEMGDRAWRVLLDRHDRATRGQIRRFGGREVGSRGDGFVGIFNSPTRAVRCAAAIADTIVPLGILLRCGVHVGEVYLKEEAITGLTAHVTARIAAAAHPGEALVSKLVRDLVVGSGLVFEDRGIHQLRGLPEETHLFALPGVAVQKPTNIVNFETRTAYQQQWPVHNEQVPDFKSLETVGTGE